MTLRDDILAQAQARSRLRYRLDPPPDGVTTTDCSKLVQDAVRAAGAGDLPRTAEQQRQATVLIPWQDAKPGDLIFFEKTYDAAGPAGPDGKIASHVGFSLGAGTRRMLDAHDREGAAPDVGITDIGTDYWQDKFLEVRRLPALMTAPPPPGELTSEPDHLFSFEELWPAIKAAGEEFGYDPKKLAGMVKQESEFRNWRVHHDGTGHGLLGLDDNGLLPDFEQWSGTPVGRGQGAASIPIVPQLRYAAMALARYARQFGGDEWAATRAWHRGTGLMNDARGQNYEQLIRAHVATLFGAGEPPVPPVQPPVDPRDARIAELEAALKAKDEQLNGFITAVAVMGDDVGDAMQAQVDKLRAIREQFVGPRPK